MAVTNINTSRLMSDSSFSSKPSHVTEHEMNNIINPEEGGVVYNTTSNQLCAYDGESWVPFMTRSATGWGRYGNTALTDVSPLSISEGVTLTIPFNEALIETNLPADIDTFLDPVGNRILPRFENDIFNFNLSFTAICSKNNGNADLIIQANGVPFRTERFVFSQGAHHTQGFNFNSTQFVSSYLSNHGFVLKVDAVWGDIEIYDVAVLVTRIYKSS